MKKIYSLFLFCTIITLSSFLTGIGDPNPSEAYQVKMVHFYPNPASSTIYFEFPGNLDKSYSLHIYNFIGKKVNEFSITNSKISLSLDGYYRGLYVFQLRDKAGNIIESGKFQVLK